MPASYTGPLLRLTQITEGPDRYRVEIALEGKNLPRQTATARFPFALSREDQVDLRWYLETYLQYPLDPNPTIAAAVERRMTAIGTQLFRAVFQSDDDNDDGRDDHCWARYIVPLPRMTMTTMTATSIQR